MSFLLFLAFIALVWNQEIDCAEKDVWTEEDYITEGTPSVVCVSNVEDLRLFAQEERVREIYLRVGTYDLLDVPLFFTPDPALYPTGSCDIVAGCGRTFATFFKMLPYPGDDVVITGDEYAIYDEYSFAPRRQPTGVLSLDNAQIGCIGDGCGTLKFVGDVTIGPGSITELSFHNVEIDGTLRFQDKIGSGDDQSKIVIENSKISNIGDVSFRATGLYQTKLRMANSKFYGYNALIGCDEVDARLYENKFQNYLGVDLLVHSSDFSSMVMKENKFISDNDGVYFANIYGDNSIFLYGNKFVSNGRCFSAMNVHSNPFTATMNHFNAYNDAFSASWMFGELRLLDNYFYSDYGRGIGIYMQYYDDVRVTGNKVTSYYESLDVYRANIYHDPVPRRQPDDGYKFQVSGNYFTKTRDYMYGRAVSMYGMKELIFADNYVYSDYGYGVYFADAYYGGTIADNVVYSKFTGIEGFGYYEESNYPLRVSGNTITTNGFKRTRIRNLDPQGLSLWGFERPVRIDNNNVRSQNTALEAYFIADYDLRVHDNYFLSGFANAASLYRVHDTYIYDNTFDSRDYFGLNIRYGWGVEINNNNLYGVKGLSLNRIYDEYDGLDVYLDVHHNYVKTHQPNWNDEPPIPRRVPSSFFPAVSGHYLHDVNFYDNYIYSEKTGSYFDNIYDDYSQFENNVIFSQYTGFTLNTDGYDTLFAGNQIYSRKGTAALLYGYERNYIRNNRFVAPSRYALRSYSEKFYMDANYFGNSRGVFAYAEYDSSVTNNYFANGFGFFEGYVDNGGYSLEVSDNWFGDSIYGVKLYAHDLLVTRNSFLTGPNDFEIVGPPAPRRQPSGLGYSLLSVHGDSVQVSNNVLYQEPRQLELGEFVGAPVLLSGGASELFVLHNTFVCNPEWVAGQSPAVWASAGQFDFVNNVVLDCQDKLTISEDTGEMTLIGNWGNLPLTVYDDGVDTRREMLEDCVLNGPCDYFPVGEEFLNYFPLLGEEDPNKLTLLEKYAPYYYPLMNASGYAIDVSTYQWDGVDFSNVDFRNEDRDDHYSCEDNCDVGSNRPFAGAFNGQVYEDGCHEDDRDPNLGCRGVTIPQAAVAGMARGLSILSMKATRYNAGANIGGERREVDADDLTFSSVCGNNYWKLAINTSNHLFMWGISVGNYYLTEDTDVPQYIPIDEWDLTDPDLRVKSIACTQSSVFVLTLNKDKKTAVYAMGRNEHHELPIEEEADEFFLVMSDVISVTTSYHSVYMVLEEDWTNLPGGFAAYAVVALGGNFFGALGVNSDEDYLVTGSYFNVDLSGVCLFDKVGMNGYVGTLCEGVSDEMIVPEVIAFENGFVLKYSSFALFYSGKMHPTVGDDVNVPEFINFMDIPESQLTEEDRIDFIDRLIDGCLFIITSDQKGLFGNRIYVSGAQDCGMYGPKSHPQITYPVELYPEMYGAYDKYSERVYSLACGYACYIMTEERIYVLGRVDDGIGFDAECGEDNNCDTIAVASEDIQYAYPVFKKTSVNEEQMLYNTFDVLYVEKEQVFNHYSDDETYMYRPVMHTDTGMEADVLTVKFTRPEVYMELGASINFIADGTDPGMDKVNSRCQHHLIGESDWELWSEITDEGEVIYVYEFVSDWLDHTDDVIGCGWIYDSDITAYDEYRNRVSFKSEYYRGMMRGVPIVREEVFFFDFSIRFPKTVLKTEILVEQDPFDFYWDGYVVDKGFDRLTRRGYVDVQLRLMKPNIFVFADLIEADDHILLDPSGNWQQEETNRIGDLEPNLPQYFVEYEDELHAGEINDGKQDTEVGFTTAEKTFTCDAKNCYQKFRLYFKVLDDHRVCTVPETEFPVHFVSYCDQDVIDNESPSLENCVVPSRETTFTIVMSVDNLCGGGLVEVIDTQFDLYLYEDWSYTQLYEEDHTFHIGDWLYFKAEVSSTKVTITETVFDSVQFLDNVGDLIEELLSTGEVVETMGTEVGFVVDDLDSSVERGFHFRIDNILVDLQPSEKKTFQVSVHLAVTYLGNDDAVVSRRQGTQKFGHAFVDQSFEIRIFNDKADSFSVLPYVMSVVGVAAIFMMLVVCVFCATFICVKDVRKIGNMKNEKDIMLEEV